MNIYDILKYNLFFRRNDDLQYYKFLVHFQIIFISVFIAKKIMLLNCDIILHNLIQLIFLKMILDCFVTINNCVMHS